jgi:hypothetical protein
MTIHTPRRSLIADAASDVNKDLKLKDQDKGKDLTDEDKDKDNDNDKDNDKHPSLKDEDFTGKNKNKDVPIKNKNFHFVLKDKDQDKDLTTNPGQNLRDYDNIKGYYNLHILYNNLALVPEHVSRAGAQRKMKRSGSKN